MAVSTTRLSGTGTMRGAGTHRYGGQPDHHDRDWTQSRIASCRTKPGFKFTRIACSVTIARRNSVTLTRSLATISSGSPGRGSGRLTDRGLIIHQDTTTHGRRNATGMWCGTGRRQGRSPGPSVRGKLRSQRLLLPPPHDRYITGRDGALTHPPPSLQSSSSTVSTLPSALGARVRHCIPKGK